MLQLVSIFIYVLTGMALFYIGYVVFTAPILIPTILRELREARRRKAGGCVACGYDLRANRQSNKCPECGARITKPPKRLTLGPF